MINIINVANRIANLMNLFRMEKKIMITKITTITLAASGSEEKNANTSLIKAIIYPNSM
jgi:hypothetical protein